MSAHFDWFWSDQHFGHENILSYSSRPFPTIEEHDTALIERFNERVKPQDLSLWVGDCFFAGPDRAADIMSQLNGRHVLVLGNHDRSAAAMCSIGFVTAVPNLALRIAGRIVRVHHKPTSVPSGEICLHGHTHTTRRAQGNRVHVGVDAWDYRPASYAEIEALVAAC